jgi:hypothetical protein
VTAIVVDGPIRAIVTRITWQPGDQRELACEGVIVGRAIVTLRDGLITVNAFVVASSDPRTLGEKRAVFFDPIDERIVALPIG